MIKIEKNVVLLDMFVFPINPIHWVKEVEEEEVEEEEVKEEEKGGYYGIEPIFIGFEKQNFRTQAVACPLYYLK